MASFTTAQGLNPNAEEFHSATEIYDPSLPDHFPLSIPCENPDPISFCPPPSQTPFFFPVHHIVDPNGVPAATVSYVFQNGVHVASFTITPRPPLPFIIIPHQMCVCVVTPSRSENTKIRALKKRPQNRASAKKRSIRSVFSSIGAENQPPRPQWHQKTENRGGNRGRDDPIGQNRLSIVVSDSQFFNGFQKRSPNRATNKPRKALIPLVPKGKHTSVMIRNIPNRYTRKMLKEFLLHHCKSLNEVNNPSFPVSAFDFIYLPIDFKSGYNQGYAFVNFTSPEAAWNFYRTRNHQSWDLFHSSKIRDLRLAKIQGKEALIKKFDRVEFPVPDYQPEVYEPGNDGFSPVEKSTIGIFPMKMK